jgi:hypothetical protein
MGNRFTIKRHLPDGCYSTRREVLRLNESDFEPHHMRAYGDQKQRMDYRHLFEESLSGQERNARRAIKKAERQRAHKEIRQQQDEGE